MADVGDVLPTVKIERASGESVELGQFLHRMVLVVAIRYYG